MKRYLMIIVSAILAGFCITLGATVYLMCLSASNGEFIGKIVGSLMFCIGLFTIIHFELWLYTGKIGYALNNKPMFLLDCLICFIGNFIGSFSLASLIKLTSASAKLEEQCIKIVNTKLDSTWYSILIMSMLCGVMIYLAVEGHKRCKYGCGKVLFAFLPIMLFIIDGFEHVVANITYFTYANIFSWKAFLYFIIMFIGNGIGSIIFDGMLKIVDKLKTENKDISTNTSIK